MQVKGGLPRAIGATALAVAAASVAWFLVGRPDIVPAWDLSSRASHIVEMATTDRVTYAFVVDCSLYTVFQAVLMGELGAPAPLRFVPFFGLGAWLVGGMKSSDAAKK